MTLGKIKITGKYEHDDRRFHITATMPHDGGLFKTHDTINKEHTEDISNKEFFMKTVEISFGSISALNDGFISNVYFNYVLDCFAIGVAFCSDKEYTPKTSDVLIASFDLEKMSKEQLFDETIKLISTALEEIQE